MKIYHYSETSVHAARVIGDKREMLERGLRPDSPDYDTMTQSAAILAAKKGAGNGATAHRFRAACAVLDYLASRGSRKAKATRKRYCDYCG